MSNNPATRRIGRNDELPRYHVYDERNEKSEYEDDITDAIDLADSMSTLQGCRCYVFDTFENAEAYHTTY